MDALDDTAPGTFEADLDGLHRTPAPDVAVDVAREATRQKLFGERRGAPKVSRFELLERVGSGGMGTVYAAHDPQLHRKVAVKLLGGGNLGATHPVGPVGDARRMLTEARAMARVSHPNVITVFEVGEYEDDSGEPVVFVAMEFVRGKTLRAWVQQQRPTPSEIVAAYAAAGRGLAAVHAAGLVHRDFKPDNVMISDDDGRVQVMDFGLARGGATIDHEATDASIEHPASSFVAELTRTGGLAGTPAYMAPEQLGRGEVDHRTDQFSFCVALYEALCGKRPYPGNSPSEVAAAVLTADEAPELPRGLVPRRVRVAIRRGLSPEPSERWPTMAQLIDQLAPRRRRRALWAGVAVGSAGIAWGVFEHVNATPPCRDGEAAFADAWDASAAARIDQAYRGVDAEYARAAAAEVTRHLDTYREEWLAEYRAACEATHVGGSQSEERLDRRMRCLDRRRGEIVAVVDVLASADAVAVENTSKVLDSLLDPRRCDDDAYLGDEKEPPASVEAQAEAEGIRHDAKKAELLWTSGATTEALALGRDALARAEQLDYLPALAEAELTCGRLEGLGGDMMRGVELVERSYTSARAGGLPLVATSAAIERAGLSATTGPDNETWLRLARTEVEANHFEHLRPSLLNAEATQKEFAGDRRGAVEAGLQRAELIEADCGRCELLASAYEGISYNYVQLGQYEDALRYAELAVEVADDTVPVDHPFRGTVLYRHGLVLEAMRRFEDAIVPLEEAYRIKSRGLAHDNPNRAGAAATLGGVYVNLGRVEEGLSLMEDAIGIARRFGNDFLTASLLHNYASALHNDGDLTGAAAAWTEGIELMERAFPDGNPGTGVLVAGLANVKVALGEHQAAVAMYDKALRLHRLQGGPDSPETATLLTLLGESLVAVGRAEEGIEHLRAAVKLTEAGPLTYPGVRSRRVLAQALAKVDPAEAREVLARITARCDALDEASREAAHCQDLSLAKLDG